MDDSLGSARFGVGDPGCDPRQRIVEFLRAEGELRPTEFLRSELEEGEEEMHPNLGPLLSFKGPLGRFWVSRQRGGVVIHAAPERLTITEAQECVKEFFQRQIPDFENRNFVQTNCECNEPYWEEDWEERPREGEASVFPNWISIQVHLDSRQVHHFSTSDLRRVRTRPTVFDEAKARVLLHDRFPEGEIIELRLMEHTTDGGESWRTIWHAVVSPDGMPSTPEEDLSIDADSGEILP